jgi:hypothetical protein
LRALVASFAIAWGGASSVSGRNIRRHLSLMANRLSHYDGSRRVVAFDRRTKVGLHHLPFAVADRVVEFVPELSGKGPRIHFIMREPSGIRIEFVFDPRVRPS